MLSFVFVKKHALFIFTLLALIWSLNTATLSAEGNEKCNLIHEFSKLELIPKPLRESVQKAKVVFDRIIEACAANGCKAQSQTFGTTEGTIRLSFEDTPTLIVLQDTNVDNTYEILVPFKYLGLPTPTETARAEKTDGVQPAIQIKPAQATPIKNNSEPTIEKKRYTADEIADEFQHVYKAMAQMTILATGEFETPNFDRNEEGNSRRIAFVIKALELTQARAAEIVRSYFPHSTIDRGFISQVVVGKRNLSGHRFITLIRALTQYLKDNPGHEVNMDATRRAHKPAISRQPNRTIQRAEYVVKIQSLARKMKKIRILGKSIDIENMTNLGHLKGALKLSLGETASRNLLDYLGIERTQRIKSPRDIIIEGAWRELLSKARESGTRVGDFVTQNNFPLKRSKLLVDLTNLFESKSKEIHPDDLKFNTEVEARAVFKKMVKVVAGYGERTAFWSSVFVNLEKQKAVTYSKEFFKNYFDLSYPTYIRLIDEITKRVNAIGSQKANAQIRPNIQPRTLIPVKPVPIVRMAKDDVTAAIGESPVFEKIIGISEKGEALFETIGTITPNQLMNHMMVMTDKTLEEFVNAVRIKQNDLGNVSLAENHWRQILGDTLMPSKDELRAFLETVDKFTR